MAFNQEMAQGVLEKLSEGMSLRKACEAVEGAKPRTILDWTESNGEFGAQYAHVRARAYEMLADELVTIADESTNDTFIDENGNERTNAEVVARSRLRVDTRKWMLSKMLPKVYGDKLDLSHSGVVRVERVEWSVIEAQSKLS